MILGDNSVDQAYIRFSPNDIRPLYRVMGKENLWKLTLPSDFDPIKARFKYKYGIRIKGHDVKVPVFGFRIDMLSKDPSYCEERSERSVKSEVQLDVFHYPDSRNYMFQTIPQSVIFYVQWFFCSVFPSTVSEFLIQIEGLDFKSLVGSAKHVQSFVNWILTQASANFVTDVQCLYLCIVLGHMESNSFYNNLSIPSGQQTAKACDRLLQCLSAKDYSSYLPTLNLKVLKKVSTLLVEKSSRPGWLTLAAYFYPYFGIKFLLDKEYARGLNYKYDIEEYKNTLKTLFLNPKEIKNQDDRIAHQKLLHVVLKSAPVLSAALDLFKRSDVQKYFASDDETVNFFVKCYQDRRQNTTTRKEIGAKLIEFFQIPKMFRDKMHKSLYPILLDYAKSEDELKDEQVDIFLNSIIMEDVLAAEQVFALLVELSKSRLVARRNLLLEILNNKLFEQFWQEAPLAKKVTICKSWVMTRVNYMRGGSISGVDKTKAVYEAIDTIMQCSLNVNNQNLVEDVSKYVVEKILVNEDGISVLQAFASIEKCAVVVQECYKSHAKKILEQAPKVVRKSSKFLKDCSSSRYACSYYS